MGFSAQLARFGLFKGPQNELPQSKDVPTPSEPSTSETADLLRCSNGNSTEQNEQLAAETVKTLNWRVLPYALLLVILSYIDRGNLGFVAADVCTELRMNHSKYGIGVGLFGAGYITSQVPSNYFLRRCGANAWFCFLMISWGVVASSFSLVQNRFEFYILRFLLGIAEGGTFPGVWYFLSSFYPNAFLTFPYAMVEASIAISTPLASPLAAGLLSLDGVFGFEGWRLLFFVEGILPILYGGLLFWILPSSPEKASYLSQSQRAWIKEQESVDSGRDRNLAREIRTVSRHKGFWIITITGLIRGALLTAAFYWTTLIIDDMLNGDDDDDDDTCAASKSTDLASVALTAVPFSISAVFSTLFGRMAGSVKNRPVVCGWIFAFSGISLIGWVLFRHVSFVLALLCLSTGISFFLAPNAFLVGLVGSFFSKETRATSIALFNTIGGIGMIIGPILLGWMVDTYGYGLAVTVLAVASVLGAVAIFFVKDPLLYPDAIREDEPDPIRENKPDADRP